MPQAARRGHGNPGKAPRGSRAAPRASDGGVRARAPAARRGVRRWSAKVTQTSNALDLESGVFELPSPSSVAESLKRSADQSKRRKAEPFRSAMSMLVFYINRAGRNLPAKQRRVLESAKDELRRLYHRPG